VPMEELSFHSVDLSHRRLPQLMQLADSAEAFYLWAEQKFKGILGNAMDLSTNLLAANRRGIHAAIRACYNPDKDETVPSLYDGAGRPYAHKKACYYFFSWLLRDAPQQRLAPLIAEAKSAAGAESAAEKLAIEIGALAVLFVKYRGVLKHFRWEAIREIAYDRLEGSRRSIQGHEIEIAIRASLVVAIEKYYKKHGNYGLYKDVVIADRQIRLGNETFDVSATLEHADPAQSCSILVPVKSRETRGGGHAHIFTRDINSAIDASKQGANNYVVAFIIAQSWAPREQEHVSSICDLAIIIAKNPNSFSAVPADRQAELDSFISDALGGSIKPKTWEAIRGLLATK
jgi:hypothetical protein